ncbi:MAG TPA: ATP-binding protein [Gammaproteobacteria bacterium]|nr:ATP-binding protein [Gammaproteobacteria bacterium]
MKKHETRAGGSASLRGRAERVLKHGQSDHQDPDNLQPEEIRALVHDLQVHQIELEMQNDELRRIQEALETARDRYEDLYDFAPVGYFTLNKKDQVLEANLTAAQLLQIDRSKLVGKTFATLVAPESRHQYQHLRQQLLSKDWATSDSILILRSNGEPLPVQLSSAIATDNNTGKISLALTDIHERKILEERRELFFSIASHELRTPVTSLNLALEMLAKSDTNQFSPDQLTMLDTACAASRRLQRLVGEILEMRRSDRDTMSYRNRIVALSPLLQEAVTQCQVLAARSEIHLELRESPVELWVDIDTDRLVQVLFNLLSNALRYSPPHGRILIESVKKDNRARVCVTDHGPGIPEEFREHVFEPFAQAEPSLEDSPVGQHLGLGLSVARTVVQRLGGQIGFTSKPHVATTFYFELPLQHAPS